MTGKFQTAVCTNAKIFGSFLPVCNIITQMEG